MLTGRLVILREKRMDDVANDYAWRCDHELSTFDAISPARLSAQEYMLSYTEELRNMSKMKRWFAIDSLDGKHIGNCMYYDVNEDRKQAKLGIMIGNRDYWGKGYGTDAVTTLVNHIFDKTDFDKIYLDTLAWNLRAQRCFQKCGFVTCGKVNKRGNDFLLMELHRSWLKPTEGNHEQC